jgi:hypothetical protein
MSVPFPDLDALHQEYERLEYEAERVNGEAMISELETLKDTINEKHCRQAYIDMYTRYGNFNRGVPRACLSNEYILVNIPIWIRREFEKRNPHYTTYGQPNVLFAKLTPSKFQ